VVAVAKRFSPATTTGSVAFFGGAEDDMSDAAGDEDGDADGDAAGDGVAGPRGPAKKDPLLSMSVTPGGNGMVSLIAGED
jgi:hypothetical protein